MHFSVLVTNTSKISTKAQLEPFNEDGEESDYWMKHTVICKGGIENYREYIQKEIIGTYKKWMAREEGNVKRYNDEIAAWTENCKSDNESYLAKVISDYEGCCVDKDGNIYILENPDWKWDWWVEGGRFRMATVKGEDAIYCKVKDIDCDKTVTRAILHKGIWVDEKDFKEEDWCEKFRKIVSDLDPELDVTIVDCHI